MKFILNLYKIWRNFYRGYCIKYCHMNKARTIEALSHTNQRLKNKTSK